MGRRSKCTGEITTKICADLSNGITTAKACENAGIAYGTFCEWRKKYPQFANVSAQAREAGIDKMGDDCIDIADNPDIDPQNKRVMVDTRLRLMGKWAPKKYGDKLLHAGPDGSGPVETKLDVTFVNAKK